MPPQGADDSDPGETGEAETKPTRSASTRSLLRQPSTDNEFPMFPFDNDPRLIAELIWESGSPSWAFTCTPAGGLNLQAFFNAGMVVVAPVVSDAHKTCLRNWASGRLAEH